MKVPENDLDKSGDISDSSATSRPGMTQAERMQRIKMKRA